jgi:hypothetical protein
MEPNPRLSASRQDARLHFQSLLRNSDLVGEYLWAARLLAPGERPFAWLSVNIRGISVPRVLITDRRLLVFSTGFRARSTALVVGYALDEVTGVRLRPRGRRSRSSSIHVRLSTRAGDHELVLEKVPTKIAREVEHFLNSSKEGREMLVRQLLESSRRKGQSLYHTRLDVLASVLVQIAGGVTWAVLRRSRAEAPWWWFLVAAGVYAGVSYFTWWLIRETRRLVQKRYKRLIPPANSTPGIRRHNPRSNVWG